MQQWSLARIATELGVSERSVSRMRREMRLAAPKPSDLSDAERARIEDMLDDGCPYTEIARTIDRSVTTVWQHAKRCSKRSSYQVLGLHHLKLAKSLGLELISGE